MVPVRACVRGHVSAIAGKELLVTDCDQHCAKKYTGCFFADHKSMSGDVDVQNLHALAIFRELEYMWASSKLSNMQKWICIAHAFCSCS
mmetsp:Transcript_26507/g.78733  ORF Transcript_26507/g.78733 Transcript_26507/m.78733 type:complete len:89 (+) Transcript_26507:960-1226(+)